MVALNVSFGGGSIADGVAGVARMQSRRLPSTPKIVRDLVLDDYVGQTIRIRATFAQITYADIRLGVTERMILRGLVNDETGIELDDYRSIPYDKHAKECAAEPGDTVVFTADIKAAKFGSQPSITRARNFQRLQG